jgi:phenol 2-monooxygenase
MATSLTPSRYDNGYREASVGKPWEKKRSNGGDEEANYDPPPSVELLTSPVHNSLGLNVLRTWPTLYDGTNSPHGFPEWWKPAKKVDVLIAGAGPSGLQVAVNLARQGVSFRIIGQPTFLIPSQPAVCHNLS